MSNKDPFEALDQYYVGVKNTIAPSTLGLAMYSKRLSIRELVFALAPLSAGALVALIVVFISFQSGIGSPAAVGPFLKGQMKSAGVVMQDMMPAPDRKRKLESSRRPWTA